MPDLFDAYLIQSGKICPYCGGTPQLATTKHGRRYECLPCNAWVGCHHGTRWPLGRLANAELRTWKMEAHAWFDPVWQSGKYTRSAAYVWLAGAMGVLRHECHIGMFDVEQCKQVVNLVKQKFYGRAKSLP